VEIRETVQEIFVPAYVEAPRSVPAKKPLFVHNSDDDLLGCSVPVYVACTRARDHLLVTSVAPASEFLDDMRV
jgi:hypothetical protein